MFARRKDMTSFHTEHPHLSSVDGTHAEQASHLSKQIPQRSLVRLCLLAMLLLILTMIEVLMNGEDTWQHWMLSYKVKIDASLYEGTQGIHI